MNISISRSYLWHEASIKREGASDQPSRFGSNAMHHRSSMYQSTMHHRPTMHAPQIQHAPQIWHACTTNPPWTTSTKHHRSSMDHTKPCSEHLSYRIFDRDSGEFSGMKIKPKNLNLFRRWWLWWWRVEGGVQPKCTFQVLSIHVMSCQYQFPYQWQPFHRYDLSHTSLADLRSASSCNIWSWPLP